jgi:hypothetical protein
LKVIFNKFPLEGFVKLVECSLSLMLQLRQLITEVADAFILLSAAIQLSKAIICCSDTYSGLNLLFCVSPPDPSRHSFSDLKGDGRVISNPNFSPDDFPHY